MLFVDLSCSCSELCKIAEELGILPDSEGSSFGEALSVGLEVRMMAYLTASTKSDFF